MKNIQQKILYREFLNKSYDFIRAPYQPEKEFYTVIQTGNLPELRNLCREPFAAKAGWGVLSHNPLHSLRYHFIITTAMVARYCIEGGMDVATAYGLSDFYIQKADVAASMEEISHLHTIMCEDYATRMHQLRIRKVYSQAIVTCIDYICMNLHSRITLRELSDYVNLNPSYLSKLFKKETGMTFTDYIIRLKIETAQNMLVYSSYDIAEIAAALAFPTQSYFAELFKKRCGTTPSAYRAAHVRTMVVPHL